MKKIEFIDFCNQKIRKWENRILQIEDKIKNLPQPEEINIDDYNKDGKLLSFYRTNTKQPFSKRIFGPSKKELREFIYQEEKRRLECTKNLLVRKINQLQLAIMTLEEETFTEEIFPNEQIIDTILEYGEKENISSKKILDLLVSLLSYTTEKDTLESQLEVNIASSFDKHNYPKKEINPEDIIFMLNKLLNMIFDKKYLDKYTITRSGIENEIMLRYQKINNKEEQREILLEEQKALAELQHYIVGTEIVAPTKTISEFKRLLKKVGLPAPQVKEYIQKMEEKIKETQAEKRKQEDEKALVTYLTPGQLKIYKEANSLINASNSEELDNLLSRSIKDVISLCRYLKLLEPSMSEIPEIYEKLGEKISILATEVAKIKHPSTKKARFNYLISNDGIPVLLRNIEILDSILYFEAYNLLRKLSLNPSAGTQCSQVDELDICKIEGRNLAIYYAQENNSIVIISLHSRNHKNHCKLTKADIEQIKYIIENEKNIEQISFQHTCEDLILQTLNLNTVENSYTLHKKKND